MLPPHTHTHKNGGEGQVLARLQPREWPDSPALIRRHTLTLSRRGAHTYSPHIDITELKAYEIIWAPSEWGKSTTLMVLSDVYRCSRWEEKLAVAWKSSVLVELCEITLLVRRRKGGGEPRPNVKKFYKWPMVSELCYSLHTNKHANIYNLIKPQSFKRGVKKKSVLYRYRLKSMIGYALKKYSAMCAHLLFYV